MKRKIALIFLLALIFAGCCKKIQPIEVGRRENITTKERETTLTLRLPEIVQVSTVPKPQPDKPDGVASEQETEACYSVVFWLGGDMYHRLQQKPLQRDTTIIYRDVLHEVEVVKEKPQPRANWLRSFFQTLGIFAAGYVLGRFLRVYAQ
jgi:hypothetical protein